MRKSGLSDEDLFQAVSELEVGLIDAHLGGYLYKKRVPLPGRGKRGGARTIVATTFSDRCFFLYGFSKNEQDSIDQKELQALQGVAKGLMAVHDQQLAVALGTGKILEAFNGRK
jgi:hypothetical protein